MPNYDASHFDPPAPVAHVTLRNPHSGATLSAVQLLVDTGADITLLPHTVVERLGWSAAAMVGTCAVACESGTAPNK